MFLARSRVQSLVRHPDFRIFRPGSFNTSTALSSAEFTNEVEEILQRNTKPLYSVAPTSLIQLSNHATEKDKTNLLSDIRFNELVSSLGDKKILKNEILLLLSTLKALDNLNVPDSDFTVKNIENSLIWKSRSCSVRELMMVFSFSASKQNKQNLRNDLLSIMERRWVEFSDATHFLALLAHQSQLSPKMMEKLEDRLQDCIEQLQPEDLVKILKMYAAHGRRRMSVLRSLAFHIGKNWSSLDIKQISNVLYSYDKLNYKDSDAVERVCSGLESRIPANNNQAVMKTLLFSLGGLKFRSDAVLEAICDWYLARLSDEKTSDKRSISTLVKTLAKLNYIPKRKKLLENVESILKYEDFEKEAYGDLLWLDYVWSLIVLERPVIDHMKLVLSPAFVSKIKTLEPAVSNQAVFKLLNINAAAESLSYKYTGPMLGVGDIVRLADQCAVTPSSFKNVVMETLTMLCPPPRFLQEDVKTKFGIALDAETIIQSSGKPLMIDPYVIKLDSKEPPKNLPDKAKRLGILVTPFQNCLLGGRGMTGATQLAVRLLQQNGYSVLVINETIINPAAKSIARAQKLDLLIKKIAAGEHQDK